MKPLIEFSVLKAILRFFLSDERDDFEASFRDFDHPHDIHHIQNKTRREPNKLNCKSNPYEGFCSVHGVHVGIHWRYCNDPHNEKDHCHENSIDDVGFGKLGVLQGFKEPPLVHKGAGKLSKQAEIGNVRKHSLFQYKEECS